VSDVPPEVDHEGPNSRPAASTGTRGAVLIGIVGAILVLLQSSYLALLGSSVPLTPTLYGIGLSLQAIGWLGLAEGAALVLFAVLLSFNPHRHMWAGIGLMTLGLVSLYGGGGFVLGALLCWVAGLLAIMARPGETNRRSWNVDLSTLEEDPVIEADLLDSGLVTSSSDGSIAKP